MKHLTIAAAIMCAATTTAASAQQIAIYPAGTETCGKVLLLETFVIRDRSADGSVFVSADERQNFELYLETSGFIAGYLTAVNAETQRHSGSGNLFSANRTVMDVWPWIISWCRINPTKTLSYATGTFVETVAGNRP
jgi:hypothetical protein